MLCDFTNAIDRISVRRYGFIYVFYEDNHVIIAYKPAGVLSQADGSNSPDMLTILKSYLKEKYNKPGQVFLGLVHRLDRPVAGVMVFAKTSKGASRISEQIRNHEFEKRYRLIADGKVGNPLSSGTLDSYLTKDSKNNFSRGSKTSGKESKECQLEYKVLDIAQYKGREISLVEVLLITGRSHQIRVQFSDEGHPLIGDSKYNTSITSSWASSVCLESFYLGFKHPTSKETMVFELSISDNEIWKVFDKERL